LLAPLLGIAGLEFVGPFEPHSWKPAGTLVLLASIGWSVWLLALGIGLLVTPDPPSAGSLPAGPAGRPP
jgi:hypothetical protein